MVCIACFVLPAAIWIWFQFIFPFLMKLKALVFPSTDDKKKLENKKEPVTETKTTPGTCPFKAFSNTPAHLDADASEVGAETKKTS